MSPILGGIGRVWVGFEGLDLRGDSGYVISFGVGCVVVTGCQVTVWVVNLGKVEG